MNDGSPHVTAYWDVYREAEVENFGQVIADYGDFFAVLASGKQPRTSCPPMDVAGALDPRNWHNVMELQFEHHNLTVLPFPRAPDVQRRSPFRWRNISPATPT